MMATEFTPNYNLDLYASGDKPNLRDQYNAAMGKIDTQLKLEADGVTNANANVMGIRADVEALTSTVEEHGVKIAGAQKTADDALSLAHANEGGIASTQADVASLQQTASSMQTQINGKAPTSHASSASTYGAASASDYGHVKLSDETTASTSATDGVAATPLAVKTVNDTLSAVKAKTDKLAVNSPVSQVEFTAPNSGDGTHGFGVTSGFSDGKPQTKLNVTNRQIGFYMNGGYQWIVNPIAHNSQVEQYLKVYFRGNVAIISFNGVEKNFTTPSEWMLLATPEQLGITASPGDNVYSSVNIDYEGGQTGTARLGSSGLHIRASGASAGNHSIYGQLVVFANYTFPSTMALRKGEAVEPAPDMPGTFTFLIVPGATQEAEQE
jgi:hypothetical protein